MSRSNKKSILLLIAFTLICVIITAIAITVTNNALSKQSEQEPEPPKETVNSKEPITVEPDGLGLKSLEERYAVQPLNIIYKEEYPEGSIDGEPPVQIQYMQIDGLKNIDVQNKINSELKTVALSQYEKGELKSKKLEYVHIYSNLYADFANVLSVEIIKYAYGAEADYQPYESHKWIGLNYDLSTGEQISFSDLFTNDANIKSIISQSAYMTFAEEFLGYYPYDSEDDDFNFWEWNGDMNDVDYSGMEDRVLKVMQGFDKNTSYPFCFDERNIYVNINGEEITINMRDFYNQIAIYNRYLTEENLFNTESPNDMYVFVQADNWGVPYRRVEKIGDNLFVDLGVLSSLGDDATAALDIESYKKEMEEQVALAKEYLDSHKDKAIVLAFKKYLGEYLSGQDFIVSEENFILTATMSKEYFDETFFPFVLDWEQNHGEVSLDDANLATFLYDRKKDDKNIKMVIDFPEGYY
ncbi:MAG: hypothetical protein J1F23_02005 [Oscillospiraceae bacterium]|nr:hypothetical protein [Oscillospiraceae bacterium]